MSNPQGTAPAADRPGWAILFAILTWAASLGLVLIFWLFWRIVSGPTHGIWALATTGAVLACGALTALAAGRQIVRGPGRTLAAAVVLLGTTPIVGAGSSSEICM